jgi:hypothetical protein
LSALIPHYLGNIRTLNKAMASGNFSERRHSAPPRSCPLCPALAKGTACAIDLAFFKFLARRANEPSSPTSLAQSVPDEHAVEFAEASQAAARVADARSRADDFYPNSNESSSHTCMQFFWSKRWRHSDHHLHLTVRWLELVLQAEVA